MAYDVHLLLSITHISPLQTSCAALLCQALPRLVHVLLLLASSLSITPLHYPLLVLHPTTYGTSLLPYTSSSTSASTLQSLILHQLSLSLSPLGPSPPSLGPKSKIHLLSATKMAGRSASPVPVYNRPSLPLTS